MDSPSNRVLICWPELLSKSGAPSCSLRPKARVSGPLSWAGRGGLSSSWAGFWGQLSVATSLLG